MGCSCAVYPKIKWTSKHLGNLKEANFACFPDPKAYDSVTGWCDRNSLIHFHQEESSAKVHPATSHTGQFGGEEIGEESRSERSPTCPWPLTSPQCRLYNAPAPFSHQSWALREIWQVLELQQGRLPRHWSREEKVERFGVSLLLLSFLNSSLEDYRSPKSKSLPF